MWPIKKYKNPHFNNKQDKHLSSKIHETNDYMHDLELSIILH